MITENEEDYQNFTFQILELFAFLLKNRKEVD